MKHLFALCFFFTFLLPSAQTLAQEYTSYWQLLFSNDLPMMHEDFGLFDQLQSAVIVIAIERGVSFEKIKTREERAEEQRRKPLFKEMTLQDRFLSERERRRRGRQPIIKERTLQERFLPQKTRNRLPLDVLSYLLDNPLMEDVKKSLILRFDEIEKMMERHGSNWLVVGNEALIQIITRYMLPTINESRPTQLEFPNTQELMEATKGHTPMSIALLYMPSFLQALLLPRGHRGGIREFEKSYRGQMLEMLLSKVDELATRKAEATSVKQWLELVFRGASPPSSIERQFQHNDDTPWGIIKNVKLLSVLTIQERLLLLRATEQIGSKRGFPRQKHKMPGEIQQLYWSYPELKRDPTSLKCSAVI